MNNDTILITPRRLTPYVLGCLLECQESQRRTTLDDVAARLPVRRSDLRRTLSALDQQGFFDLVRGRLTLSGFALARAIGERSPHRLRAALRATDGQRVAKVLALPTAPILERLAS